MPAGDLKPCGTDAAFQRHQKHGEPIDDDCRQAYRETRARYSRARGRATLRLARLPELADEYAALVASHGNHRRRCDRARRELARRHPRLFRRLLTEEIARLAIEENVSDLLDVLHPSTDRETTDVS